MNEKEENVITVSENSVEISVDAYVETLSLSLENPTDNEEIVELLTQINETLKHQDKYVKTLAFEFQGFKEEYEANNVEADEEVVETVSENTVSMNSLISKPLEEYTVTESLQVASICIVIAFAVYMIFGGRNKVR